MRRPDSTLTIDLRAAAACALAWALTLVGWLALGAVGRATSPLWFEGLSPLACWLGLSAALMSRRSTPTQRAPRAGGMLGEPAMALWTSLVAAGGLVWAVHAGSAIAAFVAAAAWAGVSTAAWRATGLRLDTPRTGRTTRAASTRVVPAIAGASLAWWMVNDLDSGITTAAAARLAVFVVICAALLAPLMRDRDLRARDVVAASCLVPASASSWPVWAARWTMLPMMATMSVAGDWCASGGVTAREAMALHFAAMLLPALLATRLAVASRHAGLSATIVVLMIAGAIAALAWPGALGWLVMSLLHAAAWSLAWAQALVRARASAQASVPGGERLAIVPAFAVLAIGLAVSRFGIGGLVAVHLGLGVVAAAGALAAGLRALHPFKEMHS